MAQYGKKRIILFHDQWEFRELTLIHYREALFYLFERAGPYGEWPLVELWYRAG